MEVCLAADETFFDQVILVMLDLPSGYIFVEEITEDCQYETWQQRVSQIFQPLALKVKYLVSDRAKAILKLALNDLGTNSISDLFHVLYDLNLRQDYQAASIKAKQIFEQHLITQSLSQSDLEQWCNWGIWMVSKFQRSSSAVEGRNGYLSQVHHNRRGLSSKRLKVPQLFITLLLKEMMALLLHQDSLVSNFLTCLNI